MGVRVSKQLIIVVVLCFIAAFLFTYMLKIFPNIMKDVTVANENIEKDIKKAAKGIIKQNLNHTEYEIQKLTNDGY
ncbi:MAG TPA: hypothetical protein ACFYEK_14750 [Candidatus Wunengus sp. YC60]|uniref:hypothetical protein n=1 Tax=Candidatus Wunengus sp. YC60 TaxID=3367697 RepID=UPI00402802C3